MYDKKYTIILDIPICAQNQTFRYEAERGEEIKVSCSVHANPTNKVR